MQNRIHTPQLRHVLLSLSLLCTAGMNAQNDVEITDNYHWFLEGLYVKCMEGYNFDRVAVVPRGTYRNNKGYTLLYPSYSGDVVVPTYVQDEFGNKMYVVSLQGSFGDCENLTSVTLSEGLEEIIGAFAGCTKLTSVTIPNSVTKLSGNVFYGCTSLTSVTLNSTADFQLDNYGIFEGCTSLTTLELPSQISILPDAAFKGCTSLTSIKLPDNISKTGDNVFEGCTSLKEITLSSAMTRIGDSQFKGCTSLNKVITGDKITEIGTSAFIGCSSLKSFVVPEGVTTLPLAAFRECENLESITLPSTLSEIKYYVFYMSDKLKDVYCLATTPPSITDGSFSTYGTLHVPAGCKSAYESADYWKEFTIVEDALTAIGHVSADSMSPVRKVMRNGSVSIEGNVRYDVSGRIMRK